MPQTPERRREYDRGRDRREYNRSWAPKGRRPGLRDRRRLTETARCTMRYLVEEQGETVAFVARVFGVSYGHAWKVVRRWKRKEAR